MHVLVVEDDSDLAAFLKKGLQLEGHEVDCVGDGDAALEAATLHAPDIMVLDLGLPRRDGLEVLRTMHVEHPHTGVLVLTGRSQVEQRVECLNAGADDFLQKPFSFHELTARCRAILRRRATPSDALLQVGDVHMNLLLRTVRYASVPLDLTVKEFQVLEALLRRRGECCSRADLLAEVWPGSVSATANVVDVYVTYLRRKFAAAQSMVTLSAALRAPVIETVRGAGYRVRGSPRAPSDEEGLHLAA